MVALVADKCNSTLEWELCDARWVAYRSVISSGGKGIKRC